jgi:hypothetical protein
VYFLSSVVYTTSAKNIFRFIRFMNHMKRMTRMKETDA